MPMYECKCAKCGNRDTVFRSLENYKDMPYHCGERMGKVMSAPFVLPDITPYKSLATGDYITSRKEHKEMLRKNGLVEVGDEKIPTHKKQTEICEKDLKQDIYDTMRGK